MPKIKKWNKEQNKQAKDTFMEDIEVTIVDEDKNHYLAEVVIEMGKFYLETRFYIEK